jgi:hypothetical protein
MHLTEFKIPSSQIRINPQKLLMLMGIQENPAPEPYSELIEKEIEFLSEYPDLQGGYSIVENLSITPGIIIFRANDIPFHVGKQVTRYLKKSEKLAFFICTAGDTISMRSRELMNKGELLQAYIADLLGSVLVEEAMDIVHKNLQDEMGKLGLKTTNRYSPGYCDWNVEEQKQLFSLFPENFCGVSLSESCLMHPIKSVSGVIGIGKNVKFHKYVCHACSNVECIYRDLKYRVNG